MCLDTEIVEEKPKVMTSIVPDFLADDALRLEWLQDSLQFDLAVLDEIWRAVVAGDCTTITDFLADASISAGSLSVDFAPFRGSYESQIFRDGIMPMRQSSVHDYLNLLSWKNFPRTKAAINRLHVEYMAQEANGQRGPQRDFLTILDEAGIVIFVEPGTDGEALGNQLRFYRKAIAATPEDQSRFNDEVMSLLVQYGAKIAVFGHALTESLVSRPDTLATTGAFSVVIPQKVNLTKSGLVHFAHVDELLEQFLCSQPGKLRPALFPSLRLDVVFQFIASVKQKHSPG